MIIYELVHTYSLHENTPCYGYKKLGYYSSIEKTREGISFYSKLPGFCDTPYGFVIRQQEVLGLKKDDCFYEACIYAHTEDFEDYEYMLNLGLFFDADIAYAAIDSFCANNALFLKSPFLEIEQLVEEYTINEHCGWLEGFIIG